MEAGQHPLDPYSSQEKHHGDYESENSHLMKGIPLSVFPMCTFRPFIRIRSCQAVGDRYQRHERKHDRGAPENDGEAEPHDKGVVQMDDGLRQKKQETRDIPDGHHGAEKASKEPSGFGLSRYVELVENRVYEGRHCELGADH
jgi:hypothetical protein